jgi:hypothetical protein
MKKRFSLLYALFLTPLCCALLFPQALLEKPRNVILIGWDGAQRNHVKESLERGSLPILKQLITEGSMVSIDVEGTTDTKAGWSQILTGYKPEITGVYSNHRFQPIPKGYTVGERLKQFFGSEFVAVAVIGKKGHVGAEPPQEVKLNKRQTALVDSLRKADKVQRRGGVGSEKYLPKRFLGGNILIKDSVVYVEMPGQPYYYSKEGMDLFINGLVENQAVCSTAIDLLEEYKNKSFFFFVHFAEVDHQGHGYGENSKEYDDALISSDRWTGKIIEKLRDLKIYDNTLIYVTADHGFDEGMKAHKGAPFVFLATNDKLVSQNGTRADITPTILARMGIDLSKIEPPLSGKSLLE